MTIKKSNRTLIKDQNLNWSLVWIDINSQVDNIIDRIDDSFVNESVYKMQTDVRRSLTDDEMLWIIDWYEYRSDIYWYDNIQEAIVKKVNTMLDQWLSNDEIDEAVKEIVENSLSWQSNFEFEWEWESIVNNIENVYNEEC